MIDKRVKNFAMNVAKEKIMMSLEYLVLGTMLTVLSS